MRLPKAAIVACLLLVGVAACALHLEGGLASGSPPAGFQSAGCGLHEKLVLSPVVPGAFPADPRLVSFPVTPGKPAAFQAPVFRPPEVPA